MISFQKYIREGVRLTPGELQKPNSKTGEDRLDILARLIKAGTPLELNKGKPFIVTEVEAALDQIAIFRKLKKPFILTGKDGKTISSSELGKSAAFGGGGGAGGGTLNTKITESHQCVICQAMLDEGIQEEDYFTNEEVLRAAYKKVEVDASIDEVLSVEGTWATSSYLSAVILINGSYINKSQTFHRNSKLMSKIYAMKNEAYKNSGQKPISDDKWNPGDFWAIDKGFDFKSLNTDNIAAYNKTILQNFVDRKLVGISLKLVKKGGKAKQYNVKLPPDTADHKILKIRFQGEKRGDFWSNKGATIVFDGGKMDFRAGSAGGAIKGEIVLKTARGGGAGYGVLQDALKSIFRKSIPDNSSVLKTAKAIAKGDKKSLIIFYNMYKGFYKNESPEEFEKHIASKDQWWIHSKLACLYVLYTVDKFGGTKANRWLTKIVNYAGSTSEDSSSYVKIYQ